MEVDGVMRENKGDDKEIRIKSRESGNKLVGTVGMKTVSKSQLNVSEDMTVLSNQSVVIDPKIRCLCNAPR